MKKYSQDTIDSLAELFCAWMGGAPENDKEIKSFLESSRMGELIAPRDLENIIAGRGYFPQETILSVYTLVPVKVKMKSKELAFFPQTFNKLNQKVSQTPNSCIININFAKASEVYEQGYAEKYKFVQENKNRLRAHNQKVKNPEAVKAAYQRRKLRMTEEEKAEYREKAKLRERKYRAADPEKAREIARKTWHRKTLEQKEMLRIESRRRNRKYREEHKEEINLKRKQYREKLKKENPELLKEIDRQRNLSADRAKTCREYYQKNKEIISEKAKANPKTKEYKRKYKLKKRFQEKTGTTILSLLQGIANSKSR